MTFFVCPVDRWMVIIRKASVRCPKALDNVYCALTSSPGFGGDRNAGSMRCSDSPCGTEFAIRATSLSSGSCTLAGMYNGPRGWSYPGACDPARELGLDGVDTELSLKLDGGPLLAESKLALPGVRVPTDAECW